MIVVDTAAMAYLILGGERTGYVDRVRRIDSEWAAPSLWRSEMRNVLLMLMRAGACDVDRALAYMRIAEDLVQQRTFVVSSARVLQCASSSPCTAYDCEFVVLAMDLGLPLVTTDAQVLRAFPSIAIAPEAFAFRCGPQSG